MHECDYPGCSKVFPKLWRLEEHKSSAHTGEVSGKMSAKQLRNYFFLFRGPTRVSIQAAENHSSELII